MRIFPFCDCFKSGFRLKLNKSGDRLTLIAHGWLDKPVECVIDTDVLRDGSSTLVTWSHDSFYTLFNFREICQALALTASEFCKTFHVPGIMQVEKCGGEAFVKVFMPKGQLTLDSDTDDYSSMLYRSPGHIHVLDIAFSYNAVDVTVARYDGHIHISLYFHKSDFWKRPVYISHGGQYEELHEGYNRVTFKYNPTEDAYIGEKNTKYKGRIIPLKELIHDI